MSGYNLGAVRGTIVVDYDGAGVARATKDVSGLKNKSGDTQKAFDSTAKGMAVGGGVIAAGLAVAAKSAMDFQKQMSGIKAVSGANEQQMEAMRTKALQLGKDTKFSASEAALAMEELVKAGLPVKDVLNGAADSAVALAAAGEIDLPQAATIASNAMNQFGLSAKDMPKVADLIAGAANASAIDVSDFGNSLQQVGAVANLAGADFKSTAVAIAAMGNAGIKGSDAGTSLKSMLSNLQPTTKKQNELMMDLGLVTKDGANAFYDATGKLKSMSDIAGVLQKSLKGMSDEQRQANLEALFGSDGIRAAAILSEEGSKGMDKLAASMSKMKAADVAKTRMDNLAGAVETMKGSAETLAIQIGTPLLGSLTEVVNKLNEAVTWFSNLDAGTQQNITTAAMWAAGLLLGGAALIKVVGFVRNLAATLGVLARATGLARVAQTLFSAAKWKDLIITGRLRAMYAADFFKGMINSMRRVVATYGALAVARTKDLAQTAALKAMYAADAMKTLITSIGRAVIAYGALGAAKAKEMATNVAYRAAQLASAVATGVATAAQWLLNAAMSANPLTLIIIAIVALVAAIVIAYRSSETFRNIIQAVFKAILSVVMSVVNWFKSVFAAVWPWVAKIIKTYMAIVKAVWSTMWNVVMTVIRVVLGVIRSVINFIVNVIRSGFNMVRSVVTTVWNFVSNFIKTAVGKIKAGIQLLANIGSIIGGFFQRAKDAVVDKISSIISTVKGIAGKIKSALGNLGSLLYNAGKDVINGLIRGIENMVGTLMKKAGDIAGKIKDKITGALKINSPAKVMIPVGSAIPEGIGVGIDKGETALMRVAGALAYNTAAAASPAVSGGSMGGARPMVPTSTYAPTVQVNVDAPQAANADQLGYIIASRVGSKISTGATSPSYPGR